MILQYPTVSVVILNYNGRKALGKILDECLESVLGSDYPAFEVLLVDNASSDDSLTHIRKTYGEDKRLRFVENATNLGFAEGNNVGIKNSKGEYIAIVNSDTRVDKAWLAELVKAVQSPVVGAGQSKLLMMKSSYIMDCAGGFVDYYGYHFERGRGENASRYNKPAEIFYAKGASAIFKRQVLEKTGLFDSGVFMYFDEVDLCWRLWLSGYKVVYVPASIVYHQSGSTAALMQSTWKRYMYSRNHLEILLKNYDLFNAIKAAKVSILFEARNVALSLSRRRPQMAIAIMKAVAWNLSHLRETWAKRQVVQYCVRRVSDKEIRKHMLEPNPPFPYYVVRPRSKY